MASFSSEHKKIVLIGTAHPLRGGLAAFNERLADEFQRMGHQVIIYTFSLQYPSVLFPGKSQYSTDPAPDNLDIRVKINSVNPLNWRRIGREINRLKPDVVVIKFWLPFMGPCFGTILRRIHKNKHSRIVSILDNVIPHEKRPGDRALIRYFIKSCDAFVAMSQKVLDDLRTFTRKKPARLIPHPLYDHFGARMPKPDARRYLKLNQEDKIILFFGFIRKYKGLDLLLEAMNDPRIRRENIRLIVAGEFYEDEKMIRSLIKKYQLQDSLILKTDFIPDSEVSWYFNACDVVVQPYRRATQSGITPMAYHFETPMIVTNVGGLPEMVPDERVGLVAEPDPQSIADAILKFYTFDESYFIENVRKEKQKYSWRNMAEAVLKLPGSSA